MKNVKMSELCRLYLTNVADKLFLIAQLSH